MASLKDFSEQHKIDEQSFTSELEQQLLGYRLTTAEILYHLPDYPTLIQSYIWQELDLAPKFPRLTAFLEFWQSNLDGPLNRVCVAHQELVSPQELRFSNGVFRLH